jgi:hypothetical protein
MKRFNASWQRFIASRAHLVWMRCREGRYKHQEDKLRNLEKTRTVLFLDLALGAWLRSAVFSSATYRVIVICRKALINPLRI